MSSTSDVPGLSQIVEEKREDMERFVTATGVEEVGEEDAHGGGSPVALSTSDG